jgi:hypothetical protein
MIEIRGLREETLWDIATAYSIDLNGALTAAGPLAYRVKVRDRIQEGLAETAGR